MVVRVVTARERGVLVGVVVRDVVAVEVVHAGVSVDETGREEGDDNEGDTVEPVDVGVSACVLLAHCPLGHVRRWRHPPVYRPLVDLSTMEERHLIITYRFDRATIQELCTQLEPDLMSAIAHPTGIPPQVQVLSVLHFLASGSFQTTVAMVSGMSQPMFSNVLSRVLSALLKHMQSYIVFPQVEHLPTVKGDSGYPNLSWLLTPARNPRTRAEERYNEAHGQTRRVIERTFGLLKARFRCLHITGGSLFYSPKKVCQIIVACCMLHNLALRQQVPFLQDDGPDGGVVAAVEPVDSDEDEAEEEDMQNGDSVIQQNFQ
ncbi:hypothetical protein NDU88_002959 [Pleurodeles waltl]|uniref:DDE Tnp4 domain-containing protein n=1 Tax=Pleurodeles waltl TaxID=8319 RepID=A0AAV7M9P5_PLEWA|nr:hypothetical protein NDU88_002959 [Pleurodeles waltl]